MTLTTRTLGRSRTRRLRRGARLHGHERVLRTRRRSRVRGDHPPRPRPRGHPPRHRRHVRPVSSTRSWWAGRSPGGGTRSCWPRSSASSAPTTRGCARSGATPTTCGRHVRRRWPGSASTTSTSTTSTGATPASRSRRRWGPWPSWSPRARCATSACRRRSPDTLRRACAVHPIAALQSEWSLWSRDIEADAVPTARELGIGIVAYSPLGRGFLTGDITSPEDFPEGDFRRFLPRFSGENFGRNLDLVERVRELAAAKGCTPGQLALAWVLCRGGGRGAHPRYQAPDVSRAERGRRRSRARPRPSSPPSTRCSRPMPPPAAATRT